MKLTLTDSSYDYPGNTASLVNYHGHPEAIIRAVDELNRQMTEGEIKTISLNPYSPLSDCEPPISYKIRTYTTLHGHTVVDECQFFSSHYIGTFSFKDVTIEITPRFGANGNLIFNYLLAYATNIYLPRAEASQALGQSTSPQWLLACLWKGMLAKALTESQIPKGYVTVTRNQKYYKGKLALQKHIRANLIDGSKFYCSYKKLTYNNTINRAIRNVISELKQMGCGALLNNLEAYNQKLASMGVEGTVNPLEISKISFTKMTAPYIPVMELSKTILNHSNVTKGRGLRSDRAYFVDVAELWEMYLLKLLQRHLTGYTVYSPNTRRGDYLLEGGMRQIRPDIIIEKDGAPVAIIDAKYKRYNRLGRTADQGVQREDLYQMSTYLYHYATPGQRIAGIFTSPVYSDEERLHKLNHNADHWIGLINLDFDSCRSLDQVHAAEAKYISSIKSAIID